MRKRHQQTIGILLGLALVWTSVAFAQEPPDAPLFAQVRTAEARSAEASNALTASLALYSASPTFRDLTRVSDIAVINGVPASQLADFIARANASQYPIDRLLLAVGQLSSISEQDLPVDAVISRYLQGIAKNVAAPRIDAAVRELHGRLLASAARIDAAYPLARVEDPYARRVAVDHGAYAIQVGVSEDLLDQSLQLAIADAHPVTEIQAPLLAMGILVSSGIEADRSLTLVSNAWGRGIRGDDLELLGKTVGSFARNGSEDPGSVVDQVMQMLDSDLSSERILQGLDNLDRATRDGQLPPGVDPSADPDRRRVGDRPQDVPKLPNPDDQPRIGDGD